PVGQDQEAHIEMCRDVALKFNQLYCGVGNRVVADEHARPGSAGAAGVFPVPRAKIGRIGRLVGLDGTNKMSKSLNNAVFLYDTAKDVQKKINRITTGRQSPTAPGAPDNVLMQYVDAFIGSTNPDRAAELKRRYVAGDNLGDGHVKAELGEAINALLEPMRARRAKLDGVAGDAVVQDVIRKGIRRANTIAEETLALAKKAMRLDFGGRTIG
ncbi:MAG: hypothetical protein K2X32_01010, partial [Phycisphaerales bacterium]|nr:hypothetical protein [Phycisphaerales bacterium]